MKRLFFISISYLLLLNSCQFITFVSHEEVSATDEIREKAFFAAEYYADASIEYVLGGEETTYVPEYSSRGLDCSGLVNNVYEYAVDNTNYSLAYVDATANGIYKNYSEALSDPKRGDLMFWADSSDYAFHIAIYWKTEGSYYYFIESNDPTAFSTQWGDDERDGTFIRKLSVNTSYNISFGRMRLIEQVFK